MEYRRREFVIQTSIFLTEADNPEMPDEDAVCHLPVVSGFCKAYFQRFFFNDKTGECEQFIYGGCGGNANNFQTLADCQKTCSQANSS